MVSITKLIRLFVLDVLIKCCAVQTKKSIGNGEAN